MFFRAVILQLLLVGLRSSRDHTESVMRRLRLVMCESDRECISRRIDFISTADPTVILTIITD